MYTRFFFQTFYQRPEIKRTKDNFLFFIFLAWNLYTYIDRNAASNVLNTNIEIMQMKTGDVRVCVCVCFPVTWSQAVPFYNIYHLYRAYFGMFSR